MKKHHNLLLAAAAALLSVGLVVGAESVSLLLQKGIFAEETERNLDAAIQIYQQITAEAAADRPLVAQAQYRLGVCYQKQGKKEEAATAFRRIVEQFATEAELVANARSRLSELGQPAGTLVIRQVWSYTNMIDSTISPDGRHLGFIDWYTGNIYVRDLATGQNRRLTEHGSMEKNATQYAESGTFSPDSKQIAYTWCNTNDDYALHVLSLEDMKSRLLLSSQTNGRLSAEDWSPDGKTIAMVADQKVGAHSLGGISLISVADGAVRKLTTLDSNLVYSLRFSPDGRYLAYNRARNLRPTSLAQMSNDIFAVDIETGASELVAEQVANEQFVGWVPRGSEILFTSERRGTKDLWSVKVKDGEAGGPPTLSKADIGEVQPIGVTLDGRFFYVPGGGDEAYFKEVYTASADFRTGKVLAPLKRIGTRVSGSHDKADRSPDGRYLFYRSAGKMPLACRLALETGELREYTKSGAWAPYIGWWRPSPDNKRVLVALGGFGGAQARGAYMLDCHSGELTAFELEGPDIALEGIRSPFVGNTVSYWRNRVDTRTAYLVRRDLDTGQETQYEVQNAFELGNPWWQTYLAWDGKTVFLLRFKPAENVDVAVAHDLATGRQKEFFTWKRRAPAGRLHYNPVRRGIQSVSEDEQGRRTTGAGGDGENPDKSRKNRVLMSKTRGSSEV
ncbi:MAG: tetratricopeptide repeat protein [Verrucomicrobia bacterium]|nr:tetratricopeptide repeat protein [Verrucomicrobiota bacterium]